MTAATSPNGPHKAAPRTGPRGAPRIATVCNTLFRAAHRRDPKATTATQLDPKAVAERALRPKHAHFQNRSPRSSAHISRMDRTLENHFRHIKPTPPLDRSPPAMPATVLSRLVSHTRRLGDETNLRYQTRHGSLVQLRSIPQRWKSDRNTLPKQSLSNGARRRSKPHQRTRSDFWSRWSSATEAASDHESHTSSPQGRFGAAATVTEVTVTTLTSHPPTTSGRLAKPQPRDLAVAQRANRNCKPEHHTMHPGGAANDTPERPALKAKGHLPEVRCLSAKRST
jgi:hypothetical protein